MGFRKTAYSRVFVDDSIPSFLTQRDDSVIPLPVAGSGRTESVEATPPVTAESSPTERFVDRRNRPFEWRPAFMARSIGLAVALNSLLYATFHYLPSAPRPVSAAPPLPPAPLQPEISRYNPSSHIITYSNNAPISSRPGAADAAKKEPQ